MTPVRSRNAVTLSAAFYAFVVLSALIGAVFSTLALRRSVDQMLDRAMAEAVSVRSEGLLQGLSRDLSDEWRQMEAVATRLSSEDPTTLRPVMDHMIAAGDIISWVGFATVDGKVTVASAGMLEGADVSERPWFRRGLEAPFAGDVHDAVLLAKLLDPDGDDPPRFLDYALPVRDPTGRLIGVLGLHINFDWAVGYVTEMSRALAIDTLLVSQDGTPIISTLEPDPARPTLAPFRLAALGASKSGILEWPDGGSYFTVIRPVQASGQTPNFGWRLIARVDQTAFANIDAGIPALLVPFVAGLVAALALATVIFVRIFVAPFAAAARNAEQIADGANVFPFESGRTRELSQLSASIARLQGQAHRGSAGTGIERQAP